MGKVLSIAQRKINRFNVESRAHKVISEEKPIPAPMHPSSKQELQRMMKEHPEILEQQLTKDSKHQSRLKDVYVKSYDSLAEELDHSQEVSRPLPQDRHTFNIPEFGYQDPVRIPPGRFSLRQAMTFITDHQSDPKLWTAEAIAKEYHISQNVTETILKYYRTFEVFIPDQGKKTLNRFATPSMVKDRLEPGKTDQQ